MNKQDLEQIQTNLELEWVCGVQEEMLSEAKKKAPEKDYSDPEKRIKILRKFQYKFLEAIEERRIMEKRYTEAFHKSIVLTDELLKLKKENEMLKMNVTL